MIWLTAQDAALVHSKVIQTTGGLDGLRDPAALEAALAAPFQSFGGQELYPDGLEKIARAAYGLAATHPFLDGNKRIGAMTMQLLLQWNGYRLSLRTGELADRFISIAAGDGNCEELLAWMRAHLAP